MFRSIALGLLIAVGAASGWLWPDSSAAISAGQIAPELSGEHWLNGKPLTIAGLKGRVVLVEFWTYG